MCPDCHKALRTKPHGKRHPNRLTLSNSGKMVRVSDMESKGLDLIEVRAH